VSCTVNCLVETEGLLKVAGSYVRCKSGNISELVQAEDCYYRPLIRSDVTYRTALYPMTLIDLEGHSLIASLSNATFRTFAH